MAPEHVMNELTTEQVELWAHLAVQQRANRAKEQAYEIVSMFAPMFGATT